jgi:hypothetical protein
MYKSLWLLTILSLLFSWNCEQGTDNLTDQASLDTEAIQSAIEDSLDLYFDILDDVSEENILNDEPNWLDGNAALGKVLCDRYRFGRIRTHATERKIDIIFDSDTTATAYVHTKMEGYFLVVKCMQDSDSISYVRYQKPMVHEIDRIVKLVKVNYFNDIRHNTNDRRRGWRIRAISLADGYSPDKNVVIEKLTIMAVGIDTVEIDDPLNYFIGGFNIFRFPRLINVVLRVQVKNNTSTPVIYPEDTEATEHVRLHYGRNIRGHFARTKLNWIEKIGDSNVYEGKWTVRQFLGMHHIVLDVIDNGTILMGNEDAYPYESNTWSAPYRVSLY